ncbi:D-alanine-D-alanine ligase [Arboricoccus pini]|uniref:D-alanine--D-alanine ligase n=1 Tax=Arboricoccus pini TaxID=1963835 RepID=A0A212QAE1_9PROT|nr:D-alanine--D-alanine ligase [Arboricoccus pini]SNB56341.1 D-alanine-D-alanine ligase [Arboricoccus pini]
MSARKPHVAVLLGGWSSEREVSLASGKACADALERRGYEVTRIDVGRDVMAVLAALKPDVCFNALHGAFGEDGRIQAVLDIMGIPYTHSGVLASAVAMDKTMAIRLFRQAGIGTPEGYETTLEELGRAGPRIDAPFVVKPAAEGSSVGVFILPDGDTRPIFSRNALDLAKRVRVERFIAGRELTCGVLDREPLAVTEIVPKDGFYDYRAKYTEGFAYHVVPAEIPPAIEALVQDWSQRAYDALGCRGVARCDFRYDPSLAEEGLSLLEANTQPGMTPLSLVPEQAAYRGIDFDELVDRLVKEARCDH